MTVGREKDNSGVDSRILLLFTMRTVVKHGLLVVQC